MTEQQTMKKFKNKTCKFFFNPSPNENGPREHYVMSINDLIFDSVKLNVAKLFIL